MSTNTATQKRHGMIAEALEQRLSEPEMDSLLADHHDQVEALLDEARQAKTSGAFAPLEPLHVFLRRARERLKADR